MKTVIVGGGRGCQAILELLDAGRLREMQLEVICVVDPDPRAPGLAYARRSGRQVLADWREALDLPRLELVLELTGQDEVLAEIYHRLPTGIRVIDHAAARVFWDIMAIEQSLREELTARTELEDRLEADRRRAQHILDSLPDIVIVLDRDKRILQANARLGEACGLELTQAIGCGCRDIFCTAAGDPLCTGRHTCPFDQAVAERRPVAQIIERQDPEHTFWEVTVCPQYDRQGELVEVVETHHPVTKRVRLQREVEARERRFRQFVDSAHDIISMKDRQGRYLVYNPASAALFRRDPAEFIGRTAEEIYEPRIARLIKEHDQEVMASGGHHTYDEHYVIDDREYDLQTVRFPLFDLNGEVEGVATIARDVTHEKQLQRQLLHSAKLAAIGKLAAGVAHEINNPLTGILAYAEDLLEDADPRDPRSEDYRVIVRETLRCRDIVRNLLDFARQQEPTFRAADLNEVAERSLALIERQARFRDVELRRRLHPDPLPVTADSRQIQQVLLNLLLNAGEAIGGRGTITISSGCEPDGRRCHVAVADTGPGVPVELRERIFEPFFSRKATSGLGLAVSWGIVERHGGTLVLEDAPGGGALFRVLLPAAPSQIRSGE